jgi:hypothetical protein
LTITVQFTAALKDLLYPVARAQVQQGKALGLSNERIYAYYSSVNFKVGITWKRIPRHSLYFWTSEAVTSIITCLVELYDTEVIDKDGELKPRIVIKALAIALVEL